MRLTRVRPVIYFRSPLRASTVVFDFLDVSILRASTYFICERTRNAYVHEHVARIIIQFKIKTFIGRVSVFIAYVFIEFLTAGLRYTHIT